MPPDARMQPVASEAVAEIGYAEADRVLFVRFHSGSLYAYLDAPPELFAAFETAESKGRFFHEAIDGALDFVRLG